MPRFVWLTPDDTNQWCDIGFIIPAALFPHLAEILADMGLDENWTPEGTLTVAESAHAFDDIYQRMNQECESFLFDEDGFLLTDELGNNLY